MNNRQIKLSALSIISVVFVIVTALLLNSEYAAYAILTSTIAVILIAYTVIYYNETRDNSAIYRNKLKRIINSFDSILVKSEKIPDMRKHSIIKVASIEDLVYAQMVIKKPIYFYEEEKSCSFILIDDKEICVYILKSNIEDITTTEILIEEIRNEPEIVDIDHSILDDIDNTTIIKLDNHKSYKVSPIRPKKTEYIKDITQVLDVVNYKNAELKEDYFIEIEPKKKKDKKEEIVDLPEVEKQIDAVVESSNTGVLDVIKTEPIDTKRIQKVLEEKEEQLREKNKKRVIEDMGIELPKTKAEIKKVEENSNEVDSKPKQKNRNTRKNNRSKNGQRKNTNKK